MKTGFFKINNVIMVLALSSQLLLPACSKVSDDEQRLQETIDDFITAIEKRQRSEVLSYLHPEFRAKGDLTSREINQLMFYHFRQNDYIKIVTGDSEISLHTPTADVTASILLVGTSGLIPERGRSYMVQMRWLLEDDRWLLSRANWQAH